MLGCEDRYEERCGGRYEGVKGGGKRRKKRYGGVRGAV